MISALPIAYDRPAFAAAPLTLRVPLAPRAAGRSEQPPLAASPAPLTQPASGLESAPLSPPAVSASAAPPPNSPAPQSAPALPDAPATPAMTTPAPPQSALTPPDPPPNAPGSPALSLSVPPAVSAPSNSPALPTPPASGSAPDGLAASALSCLPPNSPVPPAVSAPSAPAVAVPGAPAAPQFCEFAAACMPGLDLDGFHASYYRVLGAFAAGRIRRLIVTVPPQHGKSTGSSVLLPAYMLGLDPALQVAVASYSASLAQRFGRRIQRLIDTAAYAAFFPHTVIKSAGRPQSYVRSAERTEIIGGGGELTCVGREGSLTGNRLDLVIIDDLYKDALEANSPSVRDNCWEWYTSVVRTRMHNLSRELIVFTRWHPEDLIGRLAARERVVPLTRWDQLDDPPQGWLTLNFEALKESPPTEIDPRSPGEPLWVACQSAALLREKRLLDALRFECMYQGRPTNAAGLLYGDRFRTYTSLPVPIDRWGNYTDTADTGDDYLCSVTYGVDAQGDVYVVDVVYSRERMEVTEQLVASMLSRWPGCTAVVESNNGGRGFARAVQRLLSGTRVGWFHQSAGKEARILSNSAEVLRRVVMPFDWRDRWSAFARHLTGYQRRYRANRWHDAPDVLTGIVERECSDPSGRQIRTVYFGTG